MRLYNLVEFLNNINTETKLLLQVNDQKVPLGQVKLTASECLLIPGKEAFTKKKLFKLIQNIHCHTLTVWIVNDKKEKIPVYGMQISIEKGQATIM
ncbi:hypothetical protein [Lactobacillus agrestimuris]|uniref:hypothetical protein n=1 Tax=Lactobacillus agrestimuris TaxID=2941328 RepID=UPI001989C7AF|nr:hypothetical protein [Lactobacillus agrestimuris]MBD5431372.1 hypothetical protein [Lactobacillus sp.]